MLPSIYFHPRAFWYTRFSGVSRYVCELAYHLMELGVNVHIPIKHTPNEYLRRSDLYPSTSVATPSLPLWWHLASKIAYRTRWAEPFRRLELRQQGLEFMKKGNFDILHPTHNNATELLPYIGKKPLVITIHDMIHELYPAVFPATDPSAERKKQYAERADRIIAISECTKNDIVRILHIDPDKIDVVHHGNSLVLPPEHEHMQIPLPERYVLFVGQRHGYKNFTRLARAVARLMEKDDSLHLVCVGGGAFNSTELALLESLRMRHRAKYISLTDEELAVTYNRALAFIYPSEYEGFGLPILEAFACGAPVVCARASCFPEVAGDAAQYFVPTDIDEMTYQIEQVCYNNTNRSQMRTAGAMRLNNFSWNRSAQKTLDSYLKVLKKTD